MRIGLTIGSLGTGGSERQLCELAAGLARRGHDVEVGLYDGAGTWDGWLTSRGVVIRYGHRGSRREKVRWMRSWLSAARLQVVHGFMKRASSLAVLGTLPSRRVRVVATDMSTASYGRHKPALWGALALYALADAVVTQTETNRRSLARLAPWLSRRLRVIRNGVDTERFRPGERQDRPGPFRFLSVGTVYGVKNPVRVVEAVHVLARRGYRDVCLEWYGRPGLNTDGTPSEEYQRSTALVQALGLQEQMRFMGPRSDIERVYPGADALLHASIQEGTPNAVVEAMACGLPLVVSRVSDLPRIVAEANNGFVCDETRPESIADAMQAMLLASPSERAAMGARSRDLAVRWFGMDRFVGEFEALYRSLLASA